MNQHDQMREALRKAQDRIYPHGEPQYSSPEEPFDDLWDQINEALAAEPAKLLPEEFLRIRRQLEAEWAILKQLQEAQRKLVRLTDEEALMAYFSIKQRDFVTDNTIRIERLRAVMDATIAKNSAKPAQTEPTPEQHAQFAGSIAKALGKGGV